MAYVDLKADAPHYLEQYSIEETRAEEQQQLSSEINPDPNQIALRRKIELQIKALIIIILMEETLKEIKGREASLKKKIECMNSTSMAIQVVQVVHTAYILLDEENRTSNQQSLMNLLLFIRCAILTVEYYLRGSHRRAIAKDCLNLDQLKSALEEIEAQNL
jgi:hypothetical protein